MTLKCAVYWGVTCFAFASFGGCAAKIASETSIEARDLSWAMPIQAEGLPNLHKVSDELYRSAQPEEQGLTSAKALGVRTVISLRETDLDTALNEAENTQLNMVHIPIVTWNIRQEALLKALKMIHVSPKPVLLHCRHGADRTGLVVALYRMVYQDWTKDRVKDELVNGGFGYHAIFSNILKVIDDADVEAMRSAITQMEIEELSENEVEEP